MAKPEHAQYREDSLRETVRKRIGTLDGRIVALLNERAVAAHHIAMLKDKAGLPIEDLAREEEVLANVESNNDGPLRQEQIQRIFHSIIEVTKRFEQECLADRSAPLDKA